MKIIGCIPSRYASTRLPGKALCEIAGKPMVLHVVERALAAKTLDEVVVLTDDQRIYDVVTKAGHRVAMTSSSCISGTDRIVEYMQKNEHFDIFVNIQGDELLLNPRHIDQLVSEFTRDKQSPMATIGHLVSDPKILSDPTTAKIVMNNFGNAMYFSRQCIPIQKNGELPVVALVHIGLYIYRRKTLQTISSLEPGILENIEGLEQLRLLENNIAIKVVTVDNAISLSVDTPKDLSTAREFFMVSAD